MDNSIQSANESLEQASEDLEMITSPRAWTSINLTNLITSIIIALVVFVLGYIFINILVHIIKKIMAKRGVDNSAIYYLETIAKFFLYFFLVIIVANTVGIQTNSLIAIVISIGLALALALRDSLTDLASGIMVVVTKPIKVGDWVFLEDEDDFLQVIEIRLFETQLRNRQNIILIVPNSRLMSNSIKNLSKEDYVYTDVRVSVHYNSDLDKVRQVIIGVLDKNENILKDKEYLIGVEELADSGINYLISFPVAAENYYMMKLKVNEEIRNALNENDIEIPYPKLDLHIIKSLDSNGK